MAEVHELTAAYEAWVGARIPLDPAEPERTHAEMAAHELRFLRGTYYLWLVRLAELVPDALAGARGPAVGDLHVENFGTWRDDDQVRRWGVNDLDELARGALLPDLVRLAVSAALAPHLALGAKEVAEIVLDVWSTAVPASPSTSASVGSPTCAGWSPSSLTRPRATPGSGTVRRPRRPSRRPAGGRPGTSTRQVPDRWATAAPSASGRPPTERRTPARPSSSGPARPPGSGRRVRPRPGRPTSRRCSSRCALLSEARRPHGGWGTGTSATWRRTSSGSSSPAWTGTTPSACSGRLLRAPAPGACSGRLLRAMATATADVHGSDPAAFRTAVEQAGWLRHGWFHDAVHTMAESTRADHAAYRG